ncbi:hypothetical protein B0H34DRAFT_541487 [Crassisporium funariophilum]|nr:hypothetical protein B0H34DRAFT_541487 [Crassisporium funariophilum]
MPAFSILHSKTLSSARIESNTLKVFDSTTRIERTTTRIEQLLVLDQSQLARLKKMEGTVACIEITDAQTTTTNTGSTQRIPGGPELSVAISDMYLRLQIDAVDQSLTELASSNKSYPIEDLMEEYTRPFHAVIPLGHNNLDRPTHQRAVIRKTLDILSILQNKSTHSQSLSIQEGAWEMVNLAIQLHHLDMLAEATTIGTWTVGLYKTLVKMDPAIYRPYLALALHNLSRYYLTLDNQEEATQSIAECVKLNRVLQDSFSTSELRGQLGRALTLSAANASQIKDYDTSLKDAKEACEIFEQIMAEIERWENFMIAETGDGRHLETPPLVASGHEDAVSTRTGTTLNAIVGEIEDEVGGKDKLMYDYGRALHQLSYSLENAGQLKEAADVDKLALEKFRYIASLHPGTGFDADLAETLYRLSHTDFRQYISVDETLVYSLESLRLYRSLFSKNSKAYCLNFYNSLWEYAGILGGQGDHDGALEVWKEMVEVAREKMTDQLYVADAQYQLSANLRKLLRHDEAVMMRTESVSTYRTVFKSVSKFEADGCYDLAVDLQLAGRHQEAVRSAQDAVSQYRALALKDPETFTEKLAQGLTLLAHVSLTAKVNDEALNEGSEALRIFELLIKDNPGVIQSYINCLRVNLSISFQSDNEVRAIERSLDVVRHFREVILHFPTEVGWGLAEAFENHGLVLIKHARFRDAERWSEEVEAWFENLPVDNADAAERYIVCLINHGSDLDSQGDTAKALVIMEKAIAVGMRFYKGHPMTTSYSASALLRRAHLLYKLGRYVEALEASKACVAFARSNPMADVTEYSGCLAALTLSLNRNGEVQAALEAANEAVEICRSAPMDTILKKNIFSLLQLPNSLLVLSESHAESGDEQDALLFAQEAVDAVLALENPDCPLPWIMVEGTYVCTMHNLAIRLLATDNPNRCLTILLELQLLLTERIKTRHGAYPEYASVLRSLGICYCILGGEEEGEATVENVQRARRQLEMVYPGVAELVEVELRKEKARASWVAIWGKYGLRCGHRHDGDSGL